MMTFTPVVASAIFAIWCTKEKTRRKDRRMDKTTVLMYTDCHDVSLRTVTFDEFLDDVALAYKEMKEIADGDGDGR